MKKGKTMKTKRLLALILAAICLFAVAGCKNNTEDPSDPSVNPTDHTPVVTPTEPPTEDPAKEAEARDVYALIYDSTVDGDGSLYCSGTVTADNLIDRYMLKAALHMILKEISPAGDFELAGAVFRAKVQSFFGVEDIQLRSFDSSEGYSCTYDAENDRYKMTAAEGTAVDVPVWKVLVRWTFSGDTLYLYDEYLRVDFDGEGSAALYPSSEKTFLITRIAAEDTTSVNETAALEYGAQYKHTFVKNSDGTYRWVSTTPMSEK